MRNLDDVLKLRFSINLHPAKQEYLPTDYDGIIYYDRTEFDENIAALMSDLVTLAKSLIKLAEENGASKEELQKILNEKTKGIFFSTGKQGRYDDLVRGIVDVDFACHQRHLTFQKLQSNS
jgi:NTE family protein